MFRAIAASSRGRLLSFGLLTVAATITITSDAAHARRHRGHRHHVSHESSYSPPFSSIVVDANSGNVLQANAADGPRHPASLTKIMTLYLLFERLEAGKIALDDDLKVSEHASDQAPTKLGLNPGQTIEVEDAIKGLVTRSANDAAVTIAEAIGGSEENFAKLMTRKARALGMSKTVYRNASGLPDDDQVTTARDQSILGRSIQDRFPKYYKYFATNDFHFRGNVIRNHNHLLGRVEGVDGIKTGYTRASGFNLVTSIRRGNRHLVAVVMGGRSASSRDGVMRGLLAEHMDEASTRRTVAAIVERPEGKSFDDRVASLDSSQRGADVASADDDTTTRENPAISTLPATTATVPPQAKVAAAQPAPAPQPAAAPQRPAPLTSGVINAQPLATIPGSTAPLQPVKVKTLVVRAAPVKIASAGPPQIVAPAAVPATPAPAAVVAAPAPAVTSAAPTDRGAASRDVPKDLPPKDLPKTTARIEQPAQPAEYGTGKGILGVLPAGSRTPGAMAYADANPRTPIPAPAAAARAAAEPMSSRPTLKAGTWIIQVGALESEAEANKRLSEARASAATQLGKADQFTETVDKGDKRLYRARFANLDRDRAEAACKTLKRSDISCIAIKN
jgi:D-alanyl-D-alanine carboxypeptidase